MDVCRLLKDYPHSVDLSVFGLEDVERTRRFNMSSELLVQKKKWWTVMEVVDFMRERYCGSIAVEYTHISDRFQRSWIKTIFEEVEQADDEQRELDQHLQQQQQQQEAPGAPPRRKSPFHSHSLGRMTDEERREMLEILMRADHLERFLGSKFPAVKRFGIEGAEAVLPGLHSMIRTAAAQGVEGVEIGMAHRGRLNVLVNLFGKPLGAICNEFTESDVSVADVKYHLGTYAVRHFRDRFKGLGFRD